MEVLGEKSGVIIPDKTKFAFEYVFLVSFIIFPRVELYYKV